MLVSLAFVADDEGCEHDLALLEFLTFAALVSRASVNTNVQSLVNMSSRQGAFLLAHLLSGILILHEYNPEISKDGETCRSKITSWDTSGATKRQCFVI